jgi:hypothetical protein
MLKNDSDKIDAGCLDGVGRSRRGMCFVEMEREGDDGGFRSEVVVGW